MALYNAYCDQAPVYMIARQLAGRLQAAFLI